MHRIKRSVILGTIMLFFACMWGNEIDADAVTVISDVKQDNKQLEIEDEYQQDNKLQEIKNDSKSDDKKIETKEEICAVYLDGKEKTSFQMNAGEFKLALPNQNYEVTVTLYNSTGKECEVEIWDERGRQTKRKIINAGKKKVITFSVAVIDNKLNLFFKRTDLENGSLGQEEIQIKTINIKTKEENTRTNMTLHLAGDSIMHSTGENLYPRQGIGQNLYRYFDDGKVLSTKKVSTDNKLSSYICYRMSEMNIQNWSIPGHSTKSFWQNGSFDNLLCEIVPGDCVLVHFGHNDEWSKDPDIQTSLADYRKNLTDFVEGCEERGATCILLPAPPLGKFKNGKIKTCSVAYKNALRKVAQETGSIFVDTAKEIQVFMNTIGETNAKSYYMILEAGKYTNFPEGLKDTTHFNEKGAKKLAQITAIMIKENKSVPKKLRRKIHVETDYYKGISVAAKNVKISKKKGRYNISWKKHTAAKDYVIYVYDKHTKRYQKVAVTKKSSYRLSKKYNKMQRKQIKVKVKVRFSR